MERWIYLDNAATTPLDPRVLEEMMPWLTERFGNASSHHHAYGWEAEEAVETARARVAALLGAPARSLVFTSGATESNNLALKGAFGAYRSKGNHLIVSRIEHKAVLDVCAALEDQGAEVTRLPVDRFGRVDPESVREAIRDTTILVSIMHANNEIGTIQDLAAIGRICKERGVVLHTDAAQSVGKIQFDADALGVDLVSISGHKIYGPKGVGALWIRRRAPRVALLPQIDGGGHEHGFRSGTLNVPGIVGFGRAAEICARERETEAERIRALRDRLQAGIESGLEEVDRNGAPDARLPGNLNLSFGYVEGESLLMGLNGIAVSTGSACTSASLEPSHVLQAIGRRAERAQSSIRFSLGRFNTEGEIDETVRRVVSTVRRLRELSPLYEMMQEEAGSGGGDPANR
ncbi:MAG: IscS subfamily cysteine desulfurase [Candidatus Eisenbacteria bacterium]|nr:IscS subfamily cysteine desulfurase [Candidatus Latescibacterota bacterium]MBD3303419.1 IscS subfamily cysteine desulfurase [Candidatus Eisenbacteria bacterium]